MKKGKDCRKANGGPVPPATGYAAGGPVPPAGGYSSGGSVASIMQGNAGACRSGEDSTASIMKGSAGAKR